MRGRFAAAARTAAARSMSPREKEAAALAQEVYTEASDWRAEGGPIILAPVSVAARRLAEPALAQARVPVTEDNLADAAALLILGFIEKAQTITEADLAEFRAER